MNDEDTLSETAIDAVADIIEYLFREDPSALFDNGANSDTLSTNSIKVQNVTKQVRVILAEDVHARLKSRAALEKRSMAALINAAIAAYLITPLKEPTKKASKPISKS